MRNPESVLENETLKLLWDFDIQTDRLISARQPDLQKKKKKKKKEGNLPNIGLCRYNCQHHKTKRKRKER